MLLKFWLNFIQGGIVKEHTTNILNISLNKYQKSWRNIQRNFNNFIDISSAYLADISTLSTS